MEEEEEDNQSRGHVSGGGRTKREVWSFSWLAMFLASIETSGPLTNLTQKVTFVTAS